MKPIISISASEWPNCDCPIPCDESSFLTTVSYSAISDFEASNKAVYIEQNKPDIVKKFRAGKVSWARLDDETVMRDKRQIKTIYTEALKMNDSIADQDGNSTSQANSSTNPTSEFMAMLTNVVENDVENLTASILAEVNKVKVQVEAEVNTFKDTMDYEATSMIMFEVQNLLGRELKMLHTILQECIGWASPTHERYVQEKCAPKFRERISTIKVSYVGKIDVLINILQTVNDLYTRVLTNQWDGKWDGEEMELPDNLMMTYGNDTLKLLTKFTSKITLLRDKLNPIDDCLKTLDNSIPSSGSKLKFFYGAYPTIIAQAKTCQDLAEKAKKFIETYITDTYKKYLNVLKTPQIKLGEESVEFNRLLTTLDIAKGNMYSIIKKFRRIHANPTENMANMVQLITNASQLNDLESQWSRQSKEQLAEVYAGKTAYLGLEKAFLEKKDFMGNLDLLMNYMRDIQTVEDKILEAILDSQHSRKGKSVDNSTELLKEQIAKMPSYIQKVKELKDKVDVIVFTLEYRQFVGSLVEFKKSLEITKEFYK
jgi:hypothetical protein